MSDNPRGPLPPNYSRGIGPSSNPGGSLVESLGSLVDEARQMKVDFGLRPYRVFSVVVRWSGGERHRGQAQVVREEEFLPTPKSDGFGVQRELRSGGAVERGALTMSEISPRYTEDEVMDLCGRRLKEGEEHYLEVRIDERDGQTKRRRYTVVAPPERRAERFDWQVQISRQEEDRTRRGEPR